MQSNFDIVPEDLELLKSFFPGKESLMICVRCRTFDYTGKTKAERIAHIESCCTPASVPAVVPIPPVEAPMEDPPQKMEEVPSEEDQPPRPIFKVVKDQTTMV